MGILYIVGLGLSPEHLTLKAIDAISRSDIVFIESYTSIADCRLADFLSRVFPLTEFYSISRSELEERGAQRVFEELERNKAVTLAVIGDPFIATTHTALRLEALKRGHKVVYVPGINVQSYAISITGLFSYKFGASTTIVYPRWGIVSETPYRVLEANRRIGHHTFFFLDIDEDAGPMDPGTALKLLLEAQAAVGGSLLSHDTMIVVLQRLGMSGERVCYMSVKDALARSWRDPPYSLIVPGSLHPIERESLEVLRC